MPKPPQKPPPKPAEVELLTSEQVAELLKITPGSLYQATSRGLVLRGTRIPGVGLRWSKDEIHQWLADQIAEARGRK